MVIDKVRILVCLNVIHVTDELEITTSSTHIPTAQTPVMDVENSREEASDYAGQTQHEHLDGAAGRWPSRTLPTGDPRVAAAYQVAVPAHDRVRGHDQLQLSQPDPGEVVQERREEHPVRAGQSRSLDLALQDGELVTQRQDLDVLVGVAHREQPDHGEQA